jgi:hypothetical protein
MKKNNSINKRFHVLFTEEDLQLLKKESLKRKISSSELLRISLHNEIHKKSNYNRFIALKNIIQLKENS